MRAVNARTKQVCSLVESLNLDESRVPSTSPFLLSYTPTHGMHAHIIGASFYRKIAKISPGTYEYYVTGEKNKLTSSKLASKIRAAKNVGKKVQYAIMRAQYFTVRDSFSADLAFIFSHEILAF